MGTSGNFTFKNSAPMYSLKRFEFCAMEMVMKRKICRRMSVWVGLVIAMIVVFVVEDGNGLRIIYKDILLCPSIRSKDKILIFSKNMNISNKRNCI